MKFAEQSITNLQDFISKLETHLPEVPGEAIWFRGQDNIAWNLESSLVRRFRNESIEKERQLYKRFIMHAANMVDRRPSSSWEWIFLMQHYGIATRLLDWSENPLVALYFAVCNPEQDQNDGVIWMLRPQHLNNKLNVLPAHSDLPMFNIDSELDIYLPGSTSSQSGFPVAAIPQRNSARIVAQHGVFTVDAVSRPSPLNSLVNEAGEAVESDYLWRYKIPSGAKSSFRKNLQTLKIDGFQIFPEMDQIKNRVMEELQ